MRDIDKDVLTVKRTHPDFLLSSWIAWDTHHFLTPFSSHSEPIVNASPTWVFQLRFRTVFFDPSILSSSEKMVFSALLCSSSRPNSDLAAVPGRPLPSKDWLPLYPGLPDYCLPLVSSIQPAHLLEASFLLLPTPGEACSHAFPPYTHSIAKDSFPFLKSIFKVQSRNFFVSTKLKYELFLAMAMNLLRNVGMKEQPDLCSFNYCSRATIVP